MDLALNFKRRIILTILVLIIWTIFTTADGRYWDYKIYHWTGIPPYYDPELMEIYRWNRLVRDKGLAKALEEMK